MINQPQTATSDSPSRARQAEELAEDAVEWVKMHSADAVMLMGGLPL
jgi:hypothetical protein